MTPSIYKIALSCGLCLSLTIVSADAQVYNNSRNRFSSGNQKTVTGSFATGRSRGRSSGIPRGGVNVVLPGMTQTQRSSPPVYSNSRYRSVDRSASPFRSGTTAYSRYPGRIQYSTRGYGGLGPVYYGHGHHHHGHNHGYNNGYYGNLHPYDVARLYAGLPFQYSAAPGFNIGLPSIITPPIVVPFGGGPVGTFGPTFGPTLDQSTFPNIAPPSPGQIPPSPTPSASMPSTQNGEPFSALLPVDEQPLKNEFPTERVSRVDVGAVERIRSLRYQTTGDNSFVRADYPAAIAFYQTAAETAPGRQAPWLRLAWAQVTQRQFAEAAVNLKKALLLDDDPTSSWVTGRSLYGKHFDLNSAEHDQELWRWLEQRPNSTDRLLLTAAFQKVRERDSVAKELLDAAIRQGLDQSLVDAMQQVSAADDEARKQNQQPLPPANDVNADDQDGIVTPAKAESLEDGIWLNGRDRARPDGDASAGVGEPIPLAEESETPFDLTIP